jgi:hypothetical protein
MYCCSYRRQVGLDMDVTLTACNAYLGNALFLPVSGKSRRTEFRSARRGASWPAEGGCRRGCGSLSSMSGISRPLRSPGAPSSSLERSAFLLTSPSSKEARPFSRWDRLCRLILQKPCRAVPRPDFRHKLRNGGPVFAPNHETKKLFIEIALKQGSGTHTMERNDIGSITNTYRSGG